MNQGTIIVVSLLALIAIAIISYGPAVVAFHKGRIKERRRIVELAYSEPTKLNSGLLHIYSQIIGIWCNNVSR